MKPLLDVVEAVEVGHIIYHNDTMSPTIVTGCNSAESFLSGGIPLNKIYKITNIMNIIVHIIILLG